MDNQIQKNYDRQANIHQNNKTARQTRRTYQLKAFNNWIKSVLIQNSSKQLCRAIQKASDIKHDQKINILKVLDIGCGRGQDIKKWAHARVHEMVALDFSKQSIQQYHKKWEQLKQPYKLQLKQADFTSQDTIKLIRNYHFDLVSAQLCFHYMFGTQVGLNHGLTLISKYLLKQGLFIATVPDSYTIIKKMNEKGVKQNDGSYVFGNKYFSMKFNKTQFTSPINNRYGFYLEQAVGSKDQQTGQITYTDQWLIDLDYLEQKLKSKNLKIQSTMNFLQYYLKYRQDYKELFSRFKLIYKQGQHMDEDLWEIAHLYRVIICKKVEGISFQEYPKTQRLKDSSIKKKYNDQQRRNKPYRQDRDYSSKHKYNQKQRNQQRGRSRHNKQYNKY